MNRSVQSLPRAEPQCVETIFSPRLHDLTHILDFRVDDDGPRRRSSVPCRDNDTTAAPPEAFRPLFEQLHTNRGLFSFQDWLRTMLIDERDRLDSVCEAMQFLTLPSGDPGLISEFQFLTVLRGFCDCSKSDAFDFFDLLDIECDGYIGFPEMYLAVCIIVAKACKYGRKLMYLHGAALLKTLRPEVEPDEDKGPVPWEKMIGWFNVFEVPPRVVGEIAAVLRALHEEDTKDVRTDKFYMPALPVDSALMIFYQVLRAFDHGWLPHRTTISPASISLRGPDKPRVYKLCAIS